LNDAGIFNEDAGVKEDAGAKRKTHPREREEVCRWKVKGTKHNATIANCGNYRFSDI